VVFQISHGLRARIVHRYRGSISSGHGTV
jgi:hypothetical protein